LRRRAFAFAFAFAAIPALCASIGHTPQGYRAVGKIVATAWPYIAGSILPVRVVGFPVPYRVALSGEGSLRDGGLYVVPDDVEAGTATLIAGNETGLAARNVRVGAPPSASRAFLAVASYDDGIVFHDARNFSVLGVLATGGAPSDAAIDEVGHLAATDTQGSEITVASLRPWSVSHVDGVPLGDELAIDGPARAIFVTNRDLDGNGALTRIAADGQVRHVVTGQTAEGLAIDSRRQIVYVANVNDGTIAAVDARAMRVVRRFKAIARVFSLALSADGSRLYGISNQSAGSPFAAPGAAIVIDLTRATPRVVARSEDLTFPLGAALDLRTDTLFVTDESLDVVDVLDARTLRRKHGALSTCRTPWKPTLDPSSNRLFVPCARDDSVDVFDASTLQRVAGAPFSTGSYPLAVAVWPARKPANGTTP
jgi:DNA-binding beta-propeller fold protein YncE